jgi:hypothetical protein
MQRSVVHQIIGHLRAHGEAEGQTWTLAPRGGWVFVPLGQWVSNAERATILQAASLP